MYQRFPPRTSRRGVLLVTGLATLALAASACRQPTAPDEEPARDEGWRSDLQFLDSLVRTMHPPVPADPGFAAFRRSIEALSTQVPSLTDEEVGAGVQKILVAVGDGHTTIIPDDVGPITFLALMVDFYWFDDGVYVASVRPGLGNLFAARVTAVGGVPIEDVMSRIMPFVPRDNTHSGRWLGAQLMQYTSVLRSAGVPAPDQGTELSLVLDGGGPTTAVVAAHDRAALPRLHSPGGVTAATPRYLRDNDHPFWLEPLPVDHTLYVNFNGVRDDPSESLASFAQRVDGLLRSGDFSSVIVDVRLNNGGDNTLLAPLLATLRAFDEASDTHRIFTIIGRATFSAGQNFVTRLEATTRVVFVGEATGGKPNHFGDESDIPLPYSGLHVSVASRLYEDGGPADERSAIEPDIPVPVDASDYFANRDPAFDAAMAAIRNGG